jgi:hypothetical protein
MYDNLCVTADTTFQPCALETMGGHGASTNAVYYLFTKHLRDSGVPGEALKRKLKKDISFALRRGTIAQVTTLALDAAQRAAEAELAVYEVGLVCQQQVVHQRALLKARGWTTLLLQELQNGCAAWTGNVPTARGRTCTSRAEGPAPARRDRAATRAAARPAPARSAAGRARQRDRATFRESVVSFTP